MALGIATRYKAHVLVCYVCHISAAAEAPLVFAPLMPVLEPEEDDDLARQVKDELDVAGVNGDFVSLNGEVAQQLEELAERCHADLIVVGRSRHLALHLGGVPRRLLAMGHRPILVVP